MKKIIVIIAIVVLAVLAFCLIPSHKDKKVLVAYFSATGTTANVAQNLANAINADLFEIKPVKAYTADDLNWRNEKSRSSVEMANKASRPEVVSKIDDIAKYDVIFIGFPIWWEREPSIVDTFIESYDLAGKTIVPFATSGSTPSTEGAANNMRLIAPNTSIPNGKRFPADVSVDELKTWANEWL